MEFNEWLMHELERRGWNNSELARRAGVVPSTISMIISGQKEPGDKTLRGIARAFNLPPANVFRMAGLLPTRPMGGEDVDELLFYYFRMSEEDKTALRRVAQGFASDAFNDEFEPDEPGD